ncbi:MAG: hypothetical protein ACI9TZ_002237, partial [Yoonia sp.]
MQYISSLGSLRDFGVERKKGRALCKARPFNFNLLKAYSSSEEASFAAGASSSPKSS